MEKLKFGHYDNFEIFIKPGLSDDVEAQIEEFILDEETREAFLDDLYESRDMYSGNSEVISAKP